jgi:ABC-type uncharacterized transport system ATPase subunit
MDIKSLKDWWLLVDLKWADLSAIIQRFDPGPQSMDEEIEKLTGKSLLQKAIVARENRDHNNLWMILQLTWGNAPDAPYIHSISGWLDLCDLCSESWVFGESK